MTNEQKEKYLKNPVRCPYCGHHDIQSKEIEGDGKTATAEVYCFGCTRSRKDIYTLIGVEEIE